jgi:hypothetical protein
MPSYGGLLISEPPACARRANFEFDRLECSLVELLITRGGLPPSVCRRASHPSQVMHNNGSRRPSQSHQHSQPPSDPNLGRYVADSVQDAHRLLAVYPFASATPTTHGQLLIKHRSRMFLIPSQLHDTSATSPSVPPICTLNISTRTTPPTENTESTRTSFNT